MLSLADIDLLHGVVATLTDPKHRQLDWTKIDEIESKDPVYTPVSGEYLNKLLKEKIAVQKEKLLQAQALKKAQQGDPKIQTD